MSQELKKKILRNIHTTRSGIGLPKPSGLGNTNLEKLPESKSLLDIGRHHAEKLTQVCKEKEPRKKNWLEPTATWKACNPGEFNTIAIRYGGKFKDWHGSNYRPVCQARYIIRGDYFCAVIAGKVYAHKAPKGYAWQELLAVSGRPALVRKSDGAEYHIDTDSAVKKVSEIRTTLIKNANARKALKALQKTMAQDLRDKMKKIKTFSKSELLVNYQTSLKAGNCASGTNSFMAVLRLDSNKDYKLGTICKLVCRYPDKLTEFQIGRFLNVCLYAEKQATNQSQKEAA